MSIIARRVLLVDDDVPTLDMLCTWLATEGYDVRAATDWAGVEMLLADWIPDAAVVDLMMPGYDGSQVAKLLRRRLPDVRIILYTARPHAADVQDLRAAMGAHAFIAKPFDLDAFLALLNQEVWGA